MKKKLAEELIYKYLNGQCTPEEATLVEAGFLDDFKRNYREVPQAEVSAASNRISNVVATHIAAQPKTGSVKLWLRYAGIAAAVAAIVFGIWFYYSVNKPRHFEGSEATRNLYANDIAPGKQGATLTLANGKKIRLTDAANGQLAQEAGVVVTKTANGELVYEIKGNTNESNKINTLSTAKGETYMVTLPDNSKVWLNALSSITYSAGLNERGLRRVRLEGEAYFEVAKNAARPFVVETKTQTVQVLGTHFNVNAYRDEPGIKTTLLEGSVKVSASRGNEGRAEDAIILKPSQQSILSADNRISVKQIDISTIIDWKNNEFYLDKMDFKEAMRKIARWYNVEVIYGSSVPDNLEAGGWIPRNSNLSDVLKSIEGSGLVHFKIEGRKLYINK